MNNSRFVLALGAATFFACGHAKDQQIDAKPTASFKATQSAVRPQVFSLDASASTVATVGSIAKYEWTFGDEAMGAMATDLTTATTTHAYKAAGTFKITLTVYDDKDLGSDPVSQMVTVSTVNATGPTASLMGPSTGQPAMVLTFDGSGSMPANDIQSYAWDFGDTNMVAGKDKTIVQHTYTTAGTYTVALTVTDSLNASDTGQLHIAVGDVGVLAVCSWSPMPPVQGAPVSFDASNSVVPMGSSPIYVWDFGDGVMNVPGKMVSHTYTGAGPYTPKLTVTVQGKPSNTNDCAVVMPGAAPLCTGMYSWHKVGADMCGWTGTTVDVEQMANNTITLTEPYQGGSSIVYSGTWTGSNFTATGTDPQTSLDLTITGTFAGCASWTGVYDTAGFCDTNIAATKL